MKGKEKCKALKELRQKIAESNDIEYAVSECSHQGDCKGTCPKCEAELRYLEQELAKRRKLGKAVVLAGLSTCLAGIVSGCESRGEAKPWSAFNSGSTTESPDIQIDGDMTYDPSPDIEGNETYDPSIYEGDTEAAPPDYEGMEIAPTEVTEEPLEEDSMDLDGDVAPLENSDSK